MSGAPKTAMVLAAGLGTRMRPLTNDRPKPLVTVGGRTLLDHMLDRLADAGVERAIVNVHYFADQIEAHVARRAALQPRPHVLISDERAHLLETGGALAKAAPLLGAAPFYVVNTDQVWTERGESALAALGAAWDGARMDAMMMLAPLDDCLGFHGQGDFFRDGAGRLAWRGAAESAPWVYAGAYVMHPRLLAGFAPERFSALRLWEPAVAAGRVFGRPLDGFWMHVGDPTARAEAEARLSVGAPAP